MLTATELRQQDKGGFSILDGGTIYTFTINQLLYVEENSAAQKITICWIEQTEGGIQIRYSTYNLSKIAWHGPLPGTVQ